MILPAWFPVGPGPDREKHWRGLLAVRCVDVLKEEDCRVSQIIVLTLQGLLALLGHASYDSYAKED